ncbi:MAG TPA: thiamine phosphate synthase [Xanthobacteraceae bacterium]|nr:thiamine phosphate synthase [Xanthobacteraceae bacterium]
MARSNAPRLMLVTPVVADAEAFAPTLAAACAGADIAAVIVRLAGGDERTQINRLKALVHATQGRETALLVEGHPEIVARAGADGAHLAGTDALTAAIAALKPERIAGAGGLRERHDAMTAAETGADYVLFGEPDEAGHRPAIEAVIERAAWWAEIFQIPCVAYAAHLNEVDKLAAAGADFLALGDSIWAADPVRALADATAAMTPREHFA